MKKVVLKLFLLLLPVILLLASFIVLDPFRIFFSYNNYSDNLVAMTNRDFISTEMYLKNKDKYHYDSFIIGSSGTVAFKAKAWKQYLPAAASPFVFDASGESVFGIYKKITYLDKTGADINNCLLIMDTQWTFSNESDQEGHLFIKHPTIAGTSWLNFYWTFAKDYFDFKFLRNYFRFLITKKLTTEMNHYLVYKRFKYDTVTNDSYLLVEDSLLKEDQAAFYDARKDIFYKRDSVIPPAPAKISEKQLAMLKEIKSVFDKHHTDYKIIIGPFYDQVELNNKDLTILQNVFGKERVFNFSGKNQFTEAKENYYEMHHYRPNVGDAVYSIMYAKSDTLHR